MPKGIKTVRYLRMNPEQTQFMRAAAQEKYGSLRAFQDAVLRYYEQVRPDDSASISEEAIRKYMRGHPINPIPARAILLALNDDPRVSFLCDIASQQLANERKRGLGYVKV